MQLSRHLDKGFWALASNIAKALYGFFFTLWLMTVMPNDAWGIFFLVQQSYMILGPLAMSLGMHPYVKFFYEEKENLVALQTCAAILCFSISAAGIAFFVIFAQTLGGWFEVSHDYQIFYFVPLLFLASAGKLISNEIFKATHQIREFFFTEIVYFSGNVILILGLYFSSGALTAPRHILLPMLASYTLSSITGLWLARKTLRWGFRFDFSLLKKMFGFGKYTAGTLIMSSVYSYADVFVVGLYVNLETVALLSAVKIAVHGFQMFRQAMTMIGFPVFARLHNEKRDADLRAFYEKGIYYSMLLLGALSLGLILGADLLFDYVLTKYQGGANLLRLFALAGVFIGWQVVGEALLYGIGKAGKPFSARIFASLINLALNVILVQWLDIYGAVLASLITFIILALTTTYFVRREIDFSVKGILQRRKDVVVFVREYMRRKDDL